MNVLDVNVLIALYRAEHPHHETARSWWDDSCGAGEPFAVPDLVWVAFARIVTNSRALAVPATFEQAWSFADAVMAQPTYLIFSAEPRTLAGFARLCQEVGATGNLITDAYIAASSAAYGATLVTFDRDFRKFDGLRVNELAG